MLSFEGRCDAGVLRAVLEVSVFEMLLFLSAWFFVGCGGRRVWVAF